MSSTQGNSNVTSVASEQQGDSTESAAQRKKTHQKWNMAVRSYVSASLFRYVQFVNRDRDIEYGSPIQKIVCKACNIPLAEQIEYWNNYGADAVLEVMRRKRQSVTTSMRNRFSSKYESCAQM
jgi:hypothetical protein